MGTGSYEYPGCKCGLMVVDTARHDCGFAWLFQGVVVLGIVGVLLIGGLMRRKMIRRR